MEYLIVTPFRKPPLTTNEWGRAHYHTRAKAKIEVAEVVWAHAKRQRIPALRPSTISIIWYPPRRGDRDNDSLSFFLKSAKDALVNAGIWPDDNSTWIVDDHMRVMPEPDRANPRIEIRITEVETV